MNDLDVNSFIAGVLVGITFIIFVTLYYCLQMFQAFGGKEGMSSTTRLLLRHGMTVNPLTGCLDMHP